MASNIMSSRIAVICFIRFCFCMMISFRNYVYLWGILAYIWVFWKKKIIKEMYKKQKRGHNRNIQLIKKLDKEILILPLSIPPFYNGVEWGIFFKIIKNGPLYWRSCTAWRSYRRAKADEWYQVIREDNELNREIAKFILQDENMIVIEAKDGKEAVEIFKKSKEHSYDLISMDKIAQYCWKKAKDLL